MLAQQIAELDGPDALRLVEVAEPDAAASVLIEVAAAGVSFPDLLMSRGRYQSKPPLPFVPGVEVAGTVVSAADAQFERGDRVMAVTMAGGFAQRVAAPPALTLRVPSRLPMEAAGGFIMNYHTAHFALARRGRLQAHDWLVVHGAAGGLGSAAVQVGRGVGARLIAVVSNDAKADVARRAGAEHVVDAGDDWVAQVRDITGGRGADAVLDPVGGDRFEQSLRCLSPEGRLIVVGFAEGHIPALQANRVLFRNVDVVGAAWGAFLAVEPPLFAATQQALDPMIERGDVAPIIGARFPLADAADALRLLEQRRAVGKIVLTM
jgi:NADPH2:quinone reductase